MERKNDMVTDEELYGQYLCGDETGLELLIKKYGDPLTLYIDGYLHDVHEAEDLMMETFSWLFMKKPRIRNGCFKAYLYKAARHLCAQTAILQLSLLRKSLWCGHLLQFCESDGHP